MTAVVFLLVIGTSLWVWIDAKSIGVKAGQESSLGSDPVFCLQPVRRMLKYPYG
jgi:hypothetical protein